MHTSLNHTDKVSIPEIIESLKNSFISISHLKHILDSDNDILANAVFHHVENRIQKTADENELQNLFSILPSRLDGLPPESQIILAKIFRYAPYNISLLNWQKENLLPKVEVAWLQTNLLRDPSCFISYNNESVLLSAFASLDWKSFFMPEKLLDKMCASCDPKFQKAALNGIEECLTIGSIMPEMARSYLLTLLKSASEKIVADALRKIGQPWSLYFDCPKDELLSLINANNSASRAAFETLCLWNDEYIWKTVSDSTQNKYHRRYAINHLKTISHKKDIDKFLFELAQQDILFYGRSIVKCMRNFVRQGQKLNKNSIEALFHLYTDCPDITPADIVELIDDHWPAWINYVRSLAVIDNSWPRQIKLLEYSDQTITTDFLKELLLNPDMKPWQDFLIEALGRMNCSEAESEILELMDAAPDAVAEALLRIGTDKTIKVLFNRLEHAEYWNRPFNRKQTICLLLRICENVEDIIQYLEPSQILKEELLPLCAQSPAELTQFLSEICQDGPSGIREAVLGHLKNFGNVSSLKFLQVLLTDRDEETRNTVREVIKSIGARLYLARKARPVCLSDAADAKQAGEFVLADLLYNMTTDSSQSKDDLKIIFSQLTALSHPRASHYLRLWFREPDPQILKSVIACIGNTQNPRFARWIIPFLQKDDPLLVRPSLVALARMKADWTIAMIAKFLGHPNMNIKKTAAAGIADLKETSIAPQLIDWLSRHDNPGFRDILQANLEKILKSGYTCTLCAALSSLKDNRQISLILQALDGKIPINAALKAIRQKARWSSVLYQMLHDERISLTDGSKTKFVREMIRHHIPPPSNECLTISAPTSTTALEQAMTLLDSVLQNPQESPQDMSKLGNLFQTIVKHSATYSVIICLKNRLIKFLELIPDMPVNTQGFVLDLLGKMIPAVTSGERVVIAEALRQALEQEKLLFEQGIRLLRQCTDILPLSLAFKVMNNMPDDDLREWAIENILYAAQLSEKDLKNILSYKLSPSLRKYFIDTTLAHDHEQILFDGIVGNTLSYACDLRSHLSSELDHENIVGQILKVIGQCDDKIRAELLNWLAEFEDSRIEYLMISYLKSPIHFHTAQNYLKQRPSKEIADKLLAMLSDKNLQTRKVVSEILSAWPGSEYSLSVANHFLKGKLGDELPMLKLNPADLDTILMLEQNITDTSRLKRVINLIHYAQIKKTDKSKILLTLWNKQKDVFLQEQIRKMLAADSILPLILPELKQNKWGLLSLLGNQCHPFEYADLLNSSDAYGKTALLKMLGKCTSLYSGKSGLAESVLKLACSDEYFKLAIKVISRFDDWKTPERANIFASCLQPLLNNQAFQNSATEALIKGARCLPYQDQAKLLCKNINIRTCEPARSRIAELYVEEPSVIEQIPQKWRRVLQQELIALAYSRDTDKSRRTLTILAENQDENSIAIFEHSLTHPSSRVRSLAHRLLKKTATREQYLSATCLLLDDDNYQLRRTAVRTLAFNNYLPAIADMVPLLYSKKQKIDRTAREALLIYGATALPILKRLLNKARPDRRECIASVIEDIERSEEDNGITLNMTL